MYCYYIPVSKLIFTVSFEPFWICSNHRALICESLVFRKSINVNFSIGTFYFFTATIATNKCTN